MTRRTGRVLLATAAVASVGLGSALALASPATAAHTNGRYVTIKSVCAQAKNIHYASCFAMKRVPAKAGAAHAIPFAAVPHGAGPAGGFTPTQLAKAYGVNPAAATTQTIAIVDAHDDPYALTELNTFNKKYGLPAETKTSFRKVNQNGQASPLPTADAGWAGEIALDLQAVRGLCHKCKIILLEAKDSSFANLSTAVNTAVKLGAKIVSNSYGGPEQGSTPATAQAYNHKGVAILASTGDNGWFDWDTVNAGTPSASQADTPAAFPSVVAVGGTSLYTNSSGTYNHETVWNRNGKSDQMGLQSGKALGATGSGCSVKYAAPAWEKSAKGYGALGCGSGKRGTADISALADPYTGYDIFSHYNGGWQTFGGTSLSSPLVAAMWGLAGGPHGVAYPAQTLYHGYATKKASALHDVTVGSNGFCGGATKTACAHFVSQITNGGTSNPNNLAYSDGTPLGVIDCGFKFNGSPGQLTNDNQCYASAGLDGPTGVGTPKGLGVFQP